jgi:hypothetical protein
MIIVRIIGGLGNQLFQYSLGRNLAYLNNTILKLDIRGYRRTNSGDTVRRYRLDHFQTKKEIATNEEINKICSKNQAFSPIRKIKESFFPYKSPNYIKEQSPKFNPEILYTPDNTYLDGYWGSEKYFINIENFIREDLKITDPLGGINLKYSKDIVSCDSISIHIRRGDYINNPKTQEFHGNCSLEYYYNAMSIMASKIQKPHFFIFSDDCEWVKKNFTLDYPMSIMDFNGEEKDYEDLRLMTQCKHHIIANSTFSWWGAWLCSNRNKIVIAPRNWLKKSEIKTDIYPNSWILL